jgi:hypothetical protein
MGITPLRALAAEPFKLTQMVSKDFEPQIRSQEIAGSPRNGLFDALTGCGYSYPA